VLGKRTQTATTANGFTLVELMVVLFLIALLAGTVVLALPGDARALRVSAERFALHADAARNSAITSGAPVLVELDAKGYRFDRRDHGAWVPANERVFAPADWGAGITEAGPAQRIVFDEVGLASGDASVRLALGANAATVRIARDGRVSVDAPR
jgi:general secretion pathway protein H